MLGLTVLLAFLAMACGYLCMLWHLQYSQPQVWERLGRPTFWSSNISPSHGRLMRFVALGEFRAVKDNELTTYCVLYLGGTIVLLCIFAALVSSRILAL
jgi:hypothetical protein